MYVLSDINVLFIYDKIKVNIRETKWNVVSDREISIVWKTGNADKNK